MAFSAILGHDRVKALLTHALREGRLPPAVLLVGPHGVGKKALAVETARALLCERAAGDACEACSSCLRSRRTYESLDEVRRKIEDEKEPTLRNYRLHSDLLLAEPWRTGLKIDQVRQLVQELLGTPFEGRARAVVIDDAHEMTEQAQNALLKSLEEPPATSHVFLVSASPQALLPTIRSRCQLLSLGPLPLALLARHLEERLGLDPAEARLRAALGNGSLGAALAFTTDAYRERRDRMLSLLESIPGAGVVERLEAAEELSGGGESELEGTILTLRALLRDVAALNLAPQASPLNADVRDRLAALAAGPLGARAGRVAEAAGETIFALWGNASRPLAFDLLLDELAG